MNNIKENLVSGQPEALQHPKEVSDIVRSLRKIDGFMYDSQAVKSAVDTGVSTGKIGIFMLDCIVATQDVDSSGIGKIPVGSQEAIALSPLVAQTQAMKYMVELLSEQGLNVSYWIFLGDDDFAYSVSANYSVRNPEIIQAVGEQVEAVGEQLKSFFSPLGVNTHTTGWLEHEKASGIQSAREQLLDYIFQGSKQVTLPEKIAKRLQSLVNWRIDLLASFGINPQDHLNLIYEQACQELASFIVQGHAAPLVIHQQQPNLPLIFANSYPNVGTQHLDDECVRLGHKLGIGGYRYGTIHLPTPDNLSKFLGEPKDPSAITIVLGCGEKIKGQGKERWRQKQIT